MPIGRDSIEVKRCNERNKFTDVVKLDDDGRCERCRLDEGGDGWVSQPTCCLSL